MSNKIILNVGRQLGSGGSMIAKKLASDFNCTFYDKELLILAAKESGYSEKVFEKNDEHKGFLQTLFSNGTPFVSDTWYGGGMSQEHLFKLQSDAIKKAADEGSCVFVGRCADYILREYDNILNIFITADKEERIKNIMEREGFDHTAAEKFLDKKESERASYYNYYTGKRWGHSESYDLCVNSSILGIDETEEYICKFIRKRFGII